VSLLRLLEKLVQGFGLECDAVENGEDALARIADNRYGLVLADIMLPGKTGVDVYLETRKDHPHLEFVFLSGFALQERWLPLVQQSGGFIPKPYTPDSIIEVLERNFGKSETTDKKQEDD
jgi:DNA-binding NtrC family response regulator